MDRMTGKIAFRVTAVCATIACLGSASVAETAPPSLEWTRIADLPGSQHASCAAVIDGKVYLAGGQNPPGPPNYNMMRIYDSQHPELGWVDGPPMPTRRYWPGAGVIEWAGKTELYDLSADLGEEDDVAGDHPEMVAKMEAIMKEAHVPSPRWIVKPRKKK